MSDKNDHNDQAEQETAGEKKGLWNYMHEKWGAVDDVPVFGYAYVPPTPFLLKDWERYDVSRFTDAGCVSPEGGQRTVEVDPDDPAFENPDKPLTDNAISNILAEKDIKVARRTVAKYREQLGILPVKHRRKPKL